VQAAGETLQARSLIFFSRVGIVDTTFDCGSEIATARAWPKSSSSVFK
jgi:hypothetical protein